MLRGLALDDENGRSHAVEALNKFGLEFKRSYPTSSTIGFSSGAHQGANRLRGTSESADVVPRYRQGDRLNKVIKAATLHLQAHVDREGLV